MTGLVVGLNTLWHAPAPSVTRSIAVRPGARLWEATLYLPLADNQGQRFSDSQWQEALEVVTRPFGGATLGQPQEGCWIDSGQRLCREWVRPVTISFAPDRIEEFRRVVRAAGRKLGQEAIYTRFEEARVDLLFMEERLVADHR